MASDIVNECVNKSTNYANLTLWTSKADLFKIISWRVMPAKMAKTILKMMFIMFVITNMVKMIFFMIGRPAGDN